MKYRLEVDSKKAVEVLTVNGKEYKRTWTYHGNGVTGSNDDDFYERLQNDGCTDEDFLDTVWNVLDCDFCVSNFMDLCRMMEGDAE